jgi:hypothetical protein
MPDDINPAHDQMRDHINLRALELDAVRTGLYQRSCAIQRDFSIAIAVEGQIADKVRPSRNAL